MVFAKAHIFTLCGFHLLHSKRPSRSESVGTASLAIDRRGARKLTDSTPLDSVVAIIENNVCAGGAVSKALDGDVGRRL
jgi:hypothetical protein